MDSKTDERTHHGGAVRSETIDGGRTPGEREKFGTPSRRASREREREEDEIIGGVGLQITE